MPYFKDEWQYAKYMVLSFFFFSLYFLHEDPGLRYGLTKLTKIQFQMFK